MKVIFLDIDGVLNSAIWYKSREGNRCGDKRISANPMTRMLHEIDPKAVTKLNTLMASTGASVVISSSWRHVMPLDQLQQILVSRGFKFTILDYTPTRDITNGLSQQAKKKWFADKKLCRGQEIQAWLCRHPEVTKFIIVDDNSDMAHLKSHLVQTSWIDGLQENHLVKARKMLNDAI